MNLNKLCITPALALAFAATVLAQGSDDCANAQLVMGPGPHAWDNTAATATAGLTDCNGIGVRKDVWFQWVAPTTAGYVLETCGQTSIETRCNVYDGTCNSLNLLNCAAANCNGQSRVAFGAVAGTTYLFRVGSRVVGASGTGTFTIDLDPCDPAQDDGLEDNDSCMTARPMGDGLVTGLWVSKIDADWYSFSVEDQVTLSVDVLFSDALGDIDIFLLDACGGANLAVGGSASDDENVSWQNTLGCTTTVYLRVEHWAPDPVADCNDYDMMVAGTGTGGMPCSGGVISTVFCPSTPNSTGAITRLEAVGSSVSTDDDVTLRAFDMPVGSTVFIIVSDAPAANPSAPVFGGGIFCVAGQIGRLYRNPAGGSIIGQSDMNGEYVISTTAGDWSTQSIPLPNGMTYPALAGTTNYFQAWHRDMHPTMPGSPWAHLSDGAQILWN